MSNEINKIVVRVKELSTDDPKREEEYSLSDSLGKLSTQYGFIKQVKLLRKMLNSVLDKADDKKLLADPLMDALEDAEDILGYVVYKAENGTNRVKSDDDSDWSTAQKVATITNISGVSSDVANEIYADWDTYTNIN